MDRIKFLEFNGKKILYVDFSNTKYEEAKQITIEAQKIIFSSPPNSLLIINNFTDAEVTPQATYELKEYVMQNKPYVKAAAVIGIGGIKKIILNAVSKFSGRKFYAFDTVEEAVKFLAALE
jgi:hypothetical protein